MPNFLIVSQLYSGIIDKVKKDNIQNLITSFLKFLDLLLPREPGLIG